MKLTRNKPSSSLSIVIILLAFIGQSMNASVHASFMTMVGTVTSQYESMQSSLLLPEQAAYSESHCYKVAINNTQVKIADQNDQLRQLSLSEYPSSSTCCDDCSMMNCYMMSAIMKSYSFNLSIYLPSLQPRVASSELQQYYYSLYRPPIFS